MRLVDIIGRMLEEASKSRCTGRTTRGIDEARRRGASYVVYSDWHVDPHKNPSDPKFLPVENIKYTDGPLVFDHYVIEEVLYEAQAEIERLKTEIERLKSKLPEST